jgi:hypothetical protein
MWGFLLMAMLATLGGEQVLYYIALVLGMICAALDMFRYQTFDNKD